MPTLTVTVDMPEETYQNAIALSPAERARTTINTFRTTRNEQLDDELLAPELAVEDLASIGRGIADYEAGRTIPAEEVFAWERYGWTK